MNYDDGINYMISLHKKLTNTNIKEHFNVGKLQIEYPGYKKIGDYCLTINGKAPKHESIVKGLYNFVTPINFDVVVYALEDMYLHGLKAKTDIFKQTAKELIYWITLQEEINYPQPEYFGRKLSYQRFYEGALAKLNFCSLDDVISRTNNHGQIRPSLYTGVIGVVPIFYI